jgi:RHS repeat-associated protein
LRGRHIGERSIQVLPGQYFDTETATHYNYFRDYDPTIGRYIESDPIGLGGGKDTYNYSEAAPTMEEDPFGLAVYACMQPLHFLGGRGLRSGPDIPGNPLYHHYICVLGPDGKWVCGGQDRREGPFGPGKPSDDSYKLDNCSRIAEDNGCNDRCLMQKLADPNRPDYWLIGGGGRRGGGFNCQQWVAKIVSDCKRECSSTK